MPLRTAYAPRKPQPQRPQVPAARTATPAPTQQPVSAPAGITPGASAGADYSGDPILAQIRGLYGPGGSFLTGAQGTYDEGRKRELINYGWTPETDALFPDEATRAAAKANPFSVVNQLAHNNTTRETNLNEGYNKQNLFYSGHRGQALGENARTYQGEQYAASQGLGNVLRGLSTT